MTSEIMAQARALAYADPPSPPAALKPLPCRGINAPPPPPAAGLRYDDGKNRLDLIAPEWIIALGQVLTNGAAKYAARNWECGMAWSRMIGCALRHIMAFLTGERFDRETGCHHLAHAAWNVLALMSYDVRQIGSDDLPRAPFSPTMLDR